MVKRQLFNLKTFNDICQYIENEAHTHKGRSKGERLTDSHQEEIFQKGNANECQQAGNRNADVEEKVQRQAKAMWNNTTQPLRLNWGRLEKQYLLAHFQYFC